MASTFSKPAKTIDPLALDGLRVCLKTAGLYTPDMHGFDRVLRRWSDTAIKQAGAVVMPSEAADVSTALLWAQEHGIDVAVKGGGHSAAGTSSSDGGLVIDLCRMRKITVDVKNKTITAQGGAIWEEVDLEAHAHGLAAVGGTVNHTGVGGLTLGGGYGWLSGQYGLAIDNLLSVTVVLADGRVVTASATENEDLFWALRGAGHNFGVALDFTFRAYEQTEPVFSGILAFEPQYLECVVEALNNAKPDSRAAAMVIFLKPTDKPWPVIHVIPFFNGPYDEAVGHFRGLLNLHPTGDSVGMVPYKKMNTLQNPMSTYGDRKTFKGVFYQPPLDTDFARAIYNELACKIARDSDLDESAVILEFHDMRKVCEVPQTATAFASRNAIRNGILYLRWKNARKDAEHKAWGDELQARWTAQLHKQNGEKEKVDEKMDEDNEVPQYLNYAEPGNSAVPNIYGVNLRKLQGLKAKYDPTNVFNKMQPIEPVPFEADAENEKQLIDLD